MEIDFNTEKLKNLCQVGKVAQKELGAEAAKKLMLRLQQIEALTTVNELELGNPHPLTGDRLGQFSLTISGAKRLVFKPNHYPIPCHTDGGINWSQVNKVTIVFIGDYHG